MVGKSNQAIAKSNNAIKGTSYISLDVDGNAT
jgi:hypothetical protein